MKTIGIRIVAILLLMSIAFSTPVAAEVDVIRIDGLNVFMGSAEKGAGYHWYFGDGDDCRTERYVRHKYPGPGTYKVGIEVLYNDWSTSYSDFTIKVDDAGSVITVCPFSSCDYTTIQDAINFASEGDTVHVHGGTYAENLGINKAINLIGRRKGLVTIVSGSGDALDISANGVFVSGFEFEAESGGIKLRSSNNAVYCSVVNSSERKGIHVAGQNNIVMSNVLTGNKKAGIYLFYAKNSVVADNIINSNREGGVLLYASEDNIIANNTIENNIGAGINLWHYSKNNEIMNNVISHNTKSIDFMLANNYSANKFLHDFETNLLVFNEVDRENEVNDFVNFDFSMFSASGNPCSCSDYNIVISPVETVTIDQTGNNVGVGFLATRQGIYSATINVTDDEDNTVTRKIIFLVNSSSAEVECYLRSVPPTHGQPQPQLPGADAGSLLFSPPISEEDRSCGSWIQVSPDELPNHPFACVHNISINTWYKVRDEGHFGIQQYVTFDNEADCFSGVPAEDSYKWINREFTDLQWMMDYHQNWYFMALKFKGGFAPYWMTNPDNSSYVNFGYAYTTTPLIKSVSNKDILLLSATSPADDITSATIVLEGEGVTDMTVQMPNTALCYEARCNGVDCDFTQLNGKLEFDLILEGGKTIEITSN